MNRIEAIKIVKSHYPANKQMLNEALEFLVPELKESEDEKIRKKLIELFHDTVSNDQIISDYGLNKTEVLAWLEKQGEKKIIVTDEQIHWLKWLIGGLPDTEIANEAEAVLKEFVEQLEKQGK